MIKEQLEDYISKNYNKLLKAAFLITKDNTNGDLLNEVLIYLLEKKWNGDEKINWYPYIVKAMATQYISPDHYYDKNYRKYIPMFEEQEQEQEEDEYLFIYEDIINWVQNSNIFKSKIKNYYCKTIFIDYFAPEQIIQISGMTVQEVNNIRKTSFNKIAKKYNISKSSVRNAVKETIEKIKINKNRII